MSNRTEAPEWLNQRRAQQAAAAQRRQTNIDKASAMRPDSPTPDVVTSNPPEPVIIVQDEPLVVGTAKDYELRVIVTKEPSKDVTWAIGLLVALVGIGLLLLGIMPGETVYHEIAWLLVILIIVVAIKR